MKENVSKWNFISPELYGMCNLDLHIIVVELQWCKNSLILLGEVGKKNLQITSLVHRILDSIANMDQLNNRWYNRCKSVLHSDLWNEMERVNFCGNRVHCDSGKYTVYIFSHDCITKKRTQNTSQYFLRNKVCL